MHVAPTNYRFLAVVALVFMASAAVTIAWCGSMSGMGGMPMPGGWTMSMAWMRMPGQSWCGAAASFLGMWIVMMVAMMTPAVAPRLLRQQRAAAQAKWAAGYFLVWSMVGALLFPPGVALAGIAMRSPDISRAVPMLGALAVLLAGALQLGSWKSRWLACCRGEDCCGHSPRSRSAWHRGLRAGIDCCLCCAPMTMVLVVLGVMDLPVMGLVTAAIAVERLAPRGERLARAIGGAMLACGLFLLPGAWAAA